MQITIKHKGAVPGTARFKQELNRIKKIAWTQLGVFWHKELRGKHFTQAGAREYGYGRRSRKYTARKEKAKGHTDPLVYSGLSRQLSRLRDVRALTKGRGVRVHVRVPALNFRSPKSDIRMADEMTTISERESVQLVRLFNRWIERRLSRSNITHTKKIK